MMMRRRQLVKSSYDSMQQQEPVYESESEQRLRQSQPLVRPDAEEDRYYPNEAAELAYQYADTSCIVRLH